MKSKKLKTNEMSGTKPDYTQPSVKLIQVVVEKGFAGSQLPGVEDGGRPF